MIALAAFITAALAFAIALLAVAWYWSEYVRVPPGGYFSPVATPEDLLVLKAIAGRPRDIVDIEGLLAANPSVDRDRVRSVTAAFAELLEAPEILETLDRLLAATRGRVSRRRQVPSKR